MTEKQSIGDITKANIIDTLLNSKGLYDEDADIVWNAVEDCIHLKLFDNCKKLLKKFKPKAPDNILMKKILEARLYFLTNDVEKAVILLEEATKIRVMTTPRSLRLRAYAYLLLGKIFSQKRQRTKAIEAFNRGLRATNLAIHLSKRRDLPSWNIRGDLLFHLGKELTFSHNKRRAFQVLFDALKAYSETIRLTRGRDLEAYKKKVSVLRELAKIMKYTHDFEGAIEFLLDAIKIYDRIILKNTEDAKLWLEKSVILEELARMFFAAGDHKGAFFALLEAFDAIRIASKNTIAKDRILRQLMNLAADLADLSFEVGAEEIQIKFEILVVYLAKLMLEQNPKDNQAMLTKADFLVKLILSFSKSKSRDSFPPLVCEALATLEELRKKDNNSEILRRIAFLKNLLKKKNIQCDR